MKNRKFVKPLLIAVAMILVCVLSVFATIAYLTDKSEVAKNTFTVGNVQISLDEAKVDEYGDEIEGEDRVTGNTYKLVPNHTYTKDPTVTVESGSEESFVRMFVQITDLTDVKIAFGEDFLPQYFVSGWDNAVWVTTNNIVVDTDANCAYYEFRYFEAVDAREEAVTLDPLFTSFTVPAGIENTILGNLADMQINVVAQAIQADGFDTADAAFTALDVDGLTAAELATFFVAE